MKKLPFKIQVDFLHEVELERHFLTPSCCRNVLAGYTKGVRQNSKENTGGNQILSYAVDQNPDISGNGGMSEQNGNTESLLWTCTCEGPGA